MLTERFEFFIVGSEFGNAFSELNDPFDSASGSSARWRSSARRGRSLVDEDFVQALEYGLPPTAASALAWTAW